MDCKLNQDLIETVSIIISKVLELFTLCLLAVIFNEPCLIFTVSHHDYSSDVRKEIRWSNQRNHAELHAGKLII